ncbi:ThaI family type II restriction endonuclease [Chloroflexota bacterium]
MASRLFDIFTDETIANTIKNRLPYLFQLAEIESSRAGKIGMQVGSVRENIVIALLAYIFGTDNIDTDIPITEPEIDAILFGEPVSVKTITGNLTGVKLIWTVDAQKAIEFSHNYSPSCDMLLAQIKWGATGGFFYIPKIVQSVIFNNIGKERYNSISMKDG